MYTFYRNDCSLNMALNRLKYWSQQASIYECFSMLCINCNHEIEVWFSFCPFCGDEINTDHRNQPGIAPRIPPNLNEELAIRHFNSGFKYSVSLQFMSTYHGITMTHWTLSSRLRQLGLSRRTCSRRNKWRTGDSFDTPRIKWRRLPCNVRRLKRKHHVRVSRRVMRRLLREIDPKRSNERRSHRPKRREYNNPGPDFCWHADGYDKLKPHGFPIHWCIDGFSRRVLWLVVCKSNHDDDDPNNDPNWQRHWKYLNGG